jgi:predicted metal-dependent hydrolase
MVTHKVPIGEKKFIEFELIRKNVKNINITVRPDFSVMVSAKEAIPLNDIEAFVQNNSSWITKRLGRYQFTKSENDVEKEYVSGETFKFLGKQYRLIVEETTSIERVKLSNDFIKVYVRHKKKKTTKARLLDEWYRKEAKIAFSASLDRMFEIMKDKIAVKPNIDIKIMRKRWGSCLRAKNTILLNLELIKAPSYCIDYVTLHELIHLIHRNHHNDFYELLAIIMPDWKYMKEILDQEVVLYI